MSIKAKRARILLFSLIISSLSSFILYKLYIYLKSKRKPITNEKVISEGQLSKKFLSRMKKSFQTNRVTTDSTLRSQLNSCLENISLKLNLEESFANVKTDNKIWNNIKQDSIHRAVVGVLSLGIMHLVLSIQINLVSRYLFLKHVSLEKQRWKEEYKAQNKDSWWYRFFPLKETKQEEVINISREVQEEFLSNISRFSTIGVDKLIEVVRPYVQKHVERIELKRSIDHQDFTNIVKEIRSDAFLDIANSIQDMFLPPESEDIGKHPHLRCLLDEMRDILESPPFSSVLKISFDCGFNVLSKHIEQIFREIDINNKYASPRSNVQTVHVARLLPFITKEISVILDNDVSNEYVNRLYDDETIVRYIAGVYSAGVKEL